MQTCHRCKSDPWRGSSPATSATLLPSGKLSRPGRLVKALGHHTMQPNALPNMQCTMLIKRPTRKSMRILTPHLQKSIALLTSLEERTLMLFVTNQWRMMQGRCQWAKTQSRRPGYSTTKGFSTLSLTGTQTTSLSDEPPVEVPPIPITTDMVKAAISQMKVGQAPAHQHCGGDDMSSRWHRYLYDLWPRSCNHSRWQGTLWLGAEFHFLPLQG